MKNKLIIASVVAFLAGDLEAVIRANRHYRKSQRALLHKIEVEQLKVNALLTFVTDVTEENDPEGAVERFMEVKQFIDIIE